MTATQNETSSLRSHPSGRGLTSRPAPTITGGGTEAGGAEPIAKFHERYTVDSDWAGPADRLSPEEAAALQSYPTEPPFTFCGTKTKVMLQVGNAVPCLLATHILEALVFGRQDISRTHEVSNLRSSNPDLKEAT